MRCVNATGITPSINPRYFRAAGPLHSISSVIEAMKLTLQQRTSWRESTGRIGEVGPPQGGVPSSLSPYSHYVLNGESCSARLTATAVQERGFSR